MPFAALLRTTTQQHKNVGTGRGLFTTGESFTDEACLLKFGCRLQPMSEWIGNLDLRFQVQRPEALQSLVTKGLELDMHVTILLSATGTHILRIHSAFWLGYLEPVT